MSRTATTDRPSLDASLSANRGDRAFSGIALGSGLLVLAILGLIAYATAREAMPAFTQVGPAFLTSSDWNASQGRFGALALIYGTLFASCIAVVVAVPISVGIALFTTEVAPARLRRPVVHLLDLLAAVPSVVYGLWGLLVLAPAVQPFYAAIGSAVGDLPVLSLIFGGQANGKSYLTGGLILAVMIVPIITSLSREVIATVPAAQREAAVGLGATRWETITASVIPWARSGIVGAVMLGLGRAMGETIAVALVIGSSANITTHVFAPGDTMAAYIANQFGEASGTFRAALVGLGVVLFIITIVVNMTARSVVARFDRRAQGA